MGYRSNVTAVFYPEKDEDFELVKLWVDEHIMGAQDFWPYRVATSHGVRMIVFEIKSVKWYDSHAEVQMFKAALSGFEEVFGSDRLEGVPAANYEFIRMGEEPSDITELASDYFDILSTERKIVISEDYK